MRLLGALMLLAVGSTAEAAGARLRWSPAADSRVTGYDVYVRRAGTPYGAPINAGKPATQADGSLSYTVSNLTAGQTYYFAVTAYTPAPLESDLSGELAVGPSNPCVIDRCTSTSWCDYRVASDGSSCDDGLFCNGIAICEGGTCQYGAPPNCSDGVACTVDRCDDALARCVHDAQPGCCTSDADCVDSDACTAGEHCASGSCVSYPASCPETSCATAYCDPRSGCGLMPTPDGISCEYPCEFLQPRRLVLAASDDRGANLNLKAQFQTGAVVDPTVSGLTLEVADAGGTLRYSATVPPDRFISKHEGTKFRYSASVSEAQATGGITGVVMRLRRGVWSLTLRAGSNDLVDVLGEPEVAVTVLTGSTCARDPLLFCDGDPDHGTCK